MRQFILVIVITLLTSLSQVMGVLACSGGSPSNIDQIMEDVGVIVQARVIEIDDLGQNGIIQVLQYLMGGPGPEYLQFVQVPSERLVGFVENRWGSGGCATFAPHLTTGETIYLFLKRNEEGSYVPTLTPTSFNANQLVIRFPEEKSEIAIYLAHNNKHTPLLLNEREFAAFITARTGEMPTLPDSNFPYPLPAPILLRTTITTYLLPVDGAPPVELAASDIIRLRRSYTGERQRSVEGVAGCSSIGCTAYTPNGVDWAIVRDNNTILVPTGGFRTVLPGSAFVFAPTSETIAVSTNDHLTVYAFHYERYGHDFGLPKLVAVLLNTPTANFIQNVVWSPDGRVLVYSDAEGLWLWDVYTPEFEPRWNFPP